jgi:hypothetical protein
MIFILFIFIKTQFSFANPTVNDVVKNCIEKLNQNSSKQNNCIIKTEPTEKNIELSLEQLCSKKKTTKEYSLKPKEIVSMFKQMREQYFDYLQTTKDLNSEERQIITERLRLIPEPNINICDSSTLHYDNLKNKFDGCLSKNISPLQLGLIFSHEFGHTIGPCAFHAAWSPFKIKKFGKALSYSEPMNYEKSLSEFPIKSLLQCQPKTNTAVQLMNSVGNKSWNVMCAKQKQEELFADLVGSFIYLKYIKSQGNLTEGQFLELANTYCPSKGSVKSLVIEDGVQKITEKLDWIESPTSPEFKLRVSSFYEALTTLKMNNIEFNVIPPTDSLKTCFP